MPRRATSQDVANLAGVSRSAVSLVLNGRGAGNIAPDKQALIIEAAHQLDYTPNAIALSLRSRRSSTIGVVTDAIASTAFGCRLLQGAFDAAAAQGYLLLVIDTHHDPDRERQAYQTLQNRQVDGLLFVATTLRPYDSPPAQRDVAGALVNCFDDRVPSFVPDEVTGGRSLTQHLIDQGHRDIVLLTDSGDLACGLRAQGFLEAMAAAGLRAPPPVAAGREIDTAYGAAAHVLSRDRSRPTAVVCASDRSAVGVVLACVSLGLSVPADISVVGYGDDGELARSMVPALTTVRVPYREMGEQALRAVVDEIVDQPPSTLAVAPPVVTRTLLECPLVLRDSVAPPR